MRLTLLAMLGAGAAALGRPAPDAFLIEPDARVELHRLWAASLESRTERVACLASTIENDTVRITRVRPLENQEVDSVAVGAKASLDICGPPAWQGTVHTHIALNSRHQPNARFSGADRGVMLSWGQRWRSQGTFCLLYAETGVHCELSGPSGSLIFPNATY